MSQPTQTMSRTDAINLLGVHYQSQLESLSLREAKPKTLEEKLLHLAGFKADGVIRIREELGEKQETYQYATAQEAADVIAADMRERYQKRYDEIAALALGDEAKQAIADATNPAQQAVRAACTKALSTMHDLDIALRGGFTLDVHALKDTLELPAEILSVGQTVHVLRHTDAIPAISEETVTRRSAIPDFFSRLSARFDYALTGTASTATAKSEEVILSVDPNTQHAYEGLAATGKNVLVFNKAAAAKTALQDIVSDKLDALDAQKAALSQTLGNAGLKRRTP